MGDIVFILREFFVIIDVKSEVLKLICKEIIFEFVGFCFKVNLFVLRELFFEDLVKFLWEVVYDELKNRVFVYL